MDQYHLIVNLEKRQFLEPHAFGDDPKLLEFGNDSQGTMTALAVLLARDNGLAHGDLRLPENTPDRDLIGAWAGDRIAIVGDYGSSDGVSEADVAAFFQTALGATFASRRPGETPNLYAVAQAVFENPSDRVIRLLQLGMVEMTKLRHLDLSDERRSRFEMVFEGERREIEAAQKLERERLRESVLEEFSRMPVERVAELLQARAQRRW